MRYQRILIVTGAVAALGLLLSTDSLGAKRDKHDGHHPGHAGHGAVVGAYGGGGPHGEHHGIVGPVHVSHPAPHPAPHPVHVAHAEHRPPVAHEHGGQVHVHHGPVFSGGPYGGLHEHFSQHAGGDHHWTTHVPHADLHRRADDIRSHFEHHDVFSDSWVRAHHGVWLPHGWKPDAFWAPVTWTRLVNFCAFLPPQPVVIDYGTTLVYQGDMVYFEGAPLCSAAQYAQQALGIALAGAQANLPPNDQWLSLGVWGLAQGDQQNANDVFELAIDANGIIRGNYYNSLTGVNLPITGSVDRQSQRACWIIGDRQDVIYDAGIGNLSEDETQLLVHYGQSSTQQWTFVRLDASGE